jgi:hypothetical protein
MQVIEDQNLLSIGKRFSSHRSRGHTTSGGDERSKMEGFISRRGSELAFKHLCVKFGPSLFENLPKLWDCLTEFLRPVKTEDGIPEDDASIAQLGRSYEDKDPQSLINNIQVCSICSLGALYKASILSRLVSLVNVNPTCYISLYLYHPFTASAGKLSFLHFQCLRWFLQVVRSISPHLAEPLRPQLLNLLPSILGCVRHPHVAVRLAAARCITSMAKSLTDDVMVLVIENVIPMLSDLSSVCARQGAGILLSLLVQGLAVELVPYAPFLVVPLLKCMSDPDGSVRQTVTHSFAALVPLLPLSRGASLPCGLSERLSSSAEDVQFLEQLLDNTQIDDFKLNIDLNVELRRSISCIKVFFFYHSMDL